MPQPQDWRAWREETSDVCALPLVRRLAALLDRDPDSLQDGDALPQGWHMVLFTPLAPQSSLGEDGHPTAQGHFGPPDLPRRMLGGRRLTFSATLPIGAAVRRVSEVTGVDEKQGRSGRLAIVTYRHTISAGDQPAIIEEQDVIYREPASGPGAKDGSAAQEVPEMTAAHARPFHPTPALLFRYSAVTFNAHRIHYDQPYATGRENYPALVVNGGLTALMLFEMLKELGAGPLRHTSARNRRPLFCDRPARLCAAPDGEGWSLWAEDDEGRVALEASAA